MKQITLLVMTLVLLSPVAVAQRKKPAPNTEPPYVVVDPLDLRQPVPDPEAGLTQKYDGKVLRYTGLPIRWGEEPGSPRWYDLQTEITPPPSPEAKGKKSQNAPPETVTVRVSFQGQEDRRLRPQPPRVNLTVEGIGAVLADGTLLIQGAKIVRAEAPTRRQ